MHSDVNRLCNSPYFGRVLIEYADDHSTYHVRLGKLRHILKPPPGYHGVVIICPDTPQYRKLARTQVLTHSNCDVGNTNSDPHRL
eukprot:2829755-Pyramimonas_sp.AAC.2